MSSNDSSNGKGGEWISLVAFIGLVAAAAAFGGLYTPDGWYDLLNKPEWQPPNWVFAPVWTVLYLMIAVAGWLVWRSRHKRDIWFTMGLFIAQLILNAGWSWLFFGQHNIRAALADILALDIVVAVTVLLFFRVSTLAGALMLPYLAWILFATFLNYTIWTLNPAI